MEAPRFDTLLRTFAQHGTRREALGALLGGALLLGNLSEGETTEKAKRRRKRKRRNASIEILKDVSFWVNNRDGTVNVEGPYGRWERDHFSTPGGCNVVNVVDRDPGEAHRYFANDNQGFVYLNNLYWFDFDNWAFQRPTVSAAYGGRHPRIPVRNCPSPVGTAVVTRAPMDVGTEIPITLNGKVFRAKRYKDTSSNKIFEIIVPPGI